MSRRPLAWAVTALALVALALVTMHSQGPFRYQSRLPDGALVRVARLSLGTNHLYKTASAQPWQAWIGRHVPYGWFPTLEWRFPGLSVGASRSDTMSNLDVFILRTGPAKASAGKAWKLAVFDESGNSSAWASSSGASQAPDSSGKHFMEIDQFLFDAFPRRSRTLKIKMKDDNAGGELADFEAPNPFWSDYSTWEPRPLPLTNRVEDLDVCLTSFHTDTDTVAVFNISSKRKDSPWKPRTIEFSDATGNRWLGQPYLITQDVKDDGYLYGMTCRDSLWRESAWKVRLEFSKITNFDAGELWSIRGIPAPADGSTTALGCATNFGACKISLDSIERKNDDVIVSMTLDGAPDDYRLTLASATDEKGRSVKTKYERSSGMAWHQFALDATNASQINCTFAFHRSRYAEFIVAPGRN